MSLFSTNTAISETRDAEVQDTAGIYGVGNGGGMTTSQLTKDSVGVSSSSL